MISTEQFLTGVEEIAAEEPGYQKGHDGSDGYCDCIGLPIGSIRRAGGQWRGLHGSNYTARKEVRELRRITGTGDLSPGDVVFKAYEPGQGGYDLPERYEPGGEYYNGDLRDYYHVGVVISVYPLRIRHMTKPKPRMDTSIGKWGFFGKLKKVGGETAGGEGIKMETVIIAGGDVSAPIHMRKAASTGSGILADIPQGSEANLIEAGGSWYRVTWAGKTGYVMAKFVQRDTGSGANVSVPREQLEKIYDLIGEMLGMRG